MTGENSSVRETLEKAQDSLGDVFTNSAKGEDARMDTHRHIHDALTQLADLERDREAMDVLRRQPETNLSLATLGHDCDGWNWNPDSFPYVPTSTALDPADAILGTQEARDE